MFDGDSYTCGCKGIRTCALCENSERASKLKKDYTRFDEFETYIFADPFTRTAVKINVESAEKPYSVEQLFAMQERLSSTRAGDTLFCDNLILIPNFLSEREEEELVDTIDSHPWLLSQSGRRKQDYGPKVNFKERKLKLDHYAGMPSYSRNLLEKMRAHAPNDMSNYVPFELCNLEYDPSRRSCIDFHVDDTWIWGERLISVNLLAGGVMTLIENSKNTEGKRRLLYVPMARRSLLCMAGPMRYEWKHGIYAEHIDRRRIALTMREPSVVFQQNGELYEKWGRTLAERAVNYVET